MALAFPAAGQDFTTPRPSPNAKIQQTVGTTELSLSYSRPGVKNRAIWGALVPYDKPWRTGANEATTFTCTDAVMVEGQKLAAGSYAIATVPTPAKWTVAFWARPDSVGALDYDMKYDVLRVTVTPVPADMMERLQFTFDDPTADAVTLNMRWEKLSVPLKFTVDTNGKTLAAARTAVAAAKPDDWRTPYRAASWAFDAGVAPDESAKWAQSAAKAKENFQTSGTAGADGGEEWRHEERESAHAEVHRVRQGRRLDREDASREQREAAGGVDGEEVADSIARGSEPPVAFGLRGVFACVRRAGVRDVGECWALRKLDLTAPAHTTSGSSRQHRDSRVSVLCASADDVPTRGLEKSRREAR